MSTRVTLPQAGAADDASARRRLGGRARSGEGAGSLVSVAPDDAEQPVPGVVVFVDPGVWHVWLGGGRLLKTERVDPHTGVVGNELAELAAAARRFAAIEEGDEVTFKAREGRFVSGTVREKCRYGALVTIADGRLLAVGFARLRRKSWPPAGAN